VRLGSSPQGTVLRFSERTLVVKNPLAEFFLLPAAAPETASLAEPLGARVVGLGPQLRSVVTPRLGEHGLDEPPADALAPALGRDEAIETWQSSSTGPGPVVGASLHAKRHTRYLTGGFGEQQERNASGVPTWPRARASWSGGGCRPARLAVLAERHTAITDSTSSGPPRHMTTSITSCPPFRPRPQLVGLAREAPLPPRRAR